MLIYNPNNKIPWQNPDKDLFLCEMEYRKSEYFLKVFRLGKKCWRAYIMIDGEIEWEKKRFFTTSRYAKAVIEREIKNFI